MKILQRLLVPVVAFAAAGCISTADFEAVQSQVAELQDELANIKRTASSKEEVQNVNTRIAEQTEMLLKSNATLVTKVAEFDNRIQTTTGSIEDSTNRMDQLSRQLAQTQRDLEDLRTQFAAALQAMASA